MKKLIMLSLIFSTAPIVGMQTLQPSIYKTDEIELKQVTFGQRTISLLIFMHADKKYDMLKIVDQSNDNQTISIDCGNSPFTQDECQEKFAAIEAMKNNEPQGLSKK